MVLLPFCANKSGEWVGTRTTIYKVVIKYGSVEDEFRRIIKKILQNHIEAEKGKKKEKNRGEGRLFDSQ